MAVNCQNLLFGFLPKTWAKNAQKSAPGLILRITSDFMTYNPTNLYVVSRLLLVLIHNLNIELCIHAFRSRLCTILDTVLVVAT
jgi:hypothetical protein